MFTFRAAFFVNGLKWGKTLPELFSTKQHILPVSVNMKNKDKKFQFNINYLNKKKIK